MKKTLPIIAVCLLVLAWFAGTKARKPECYGDAIVTKVTSVYDGDTFRCNIKEYPPIIGENIPIRIKGIDTPELRDKRKEVKELAYKARDFTVRKLRIARVVKLKNMERGKYFRILAEVEVDGNSLGQQLLANGLAKPYFGGKKPSWGKEINDTVTETEK